MHTHAYGNAGGQRIPREWGRLSYLMARQLWEPRGLLPADNGKTKPADSQRCWQVRQVPKTEKRWKLRFPLWQRGRFHEKFNSSDFIPKNSNFLKPFICLNFAKSHHEVIKKKRFICIRIVNIIQAQRSGGFTKLKLQMVWGVGGCGGYKNMKTIGGFNNGSPAALYKPTETLSKNR